MEVPDPLILLFIALIVLFATLSRYVFLGLIIANVVNFLNFFKTCYWLITFENKTPEACSEPCQISEIECFAKKR